MDSGNSGSMQSSSGGDEEYDSRADSISAFFNTPGGALANLSHQYHTRVPSTSLHHYHPPAANAGAASTSSTPLFDPLYNVYFDGLARSPPTLTSGSSPLRSLDMPWPPRGVGPSNPSTSCTDNFGLMASAPLPTTGTAVSFPMGTGRDHLYSGGASPLPSSSLPPLHQQQPSSAPPPQNPATSPAAGAAPARSSKKRSRASRRASTTVLTTDTSNFRAMVQEFTGLPAPPFSSSPFPRARFDLLHAAASSVMRSSAMSDASPHYLLRPFAQQLPVLSSGPFSSLGSSSAPSFVPAAIPGTVVSSTRDQNVAAATLVNATTVAVTATASTPMTSAIADSTNTTTSVATASAAISTNTASTASYQLPSDYLGLQSQHQSLPSMFDYTSLAQTSTFPISTKYSSASVAPPMVGSKKASPGGTPSMGASTADHYTVAGGGVRLHGHADARLATTQSSTEPAGMASSRGGGNGEAAGDDLLRWVDEGSDRGDQFRPAGGSCSGSQRGSGCKLNYGGAASSDYHAEKGAESNVSTTRGEGMVESWICSSD